MKSPFDSKTPVALAQAYVHSVELFSRARFSIETKNALREVTNGRVWDEPTFDGYGWKLFVNGPSNETIDVLDAYFQEGMSICALHIGFDFDPAEGIARELVVNLINNHFHLRGRRSSDEIYVWGEFRSTTDIAVRRRNGQRRPSKVGAFYHDKPGKLDGEFDKPRYEIRFETGRAVKAIGILRPGDIRNIQPRQIFAKHITIRDHAERLIKETIRTTKPTPYIDVPLRVRALLIRTDMGSLTEWKRRRGRHQFGRLSDRMELVEIDPVLHFFPKKRSVKGMRKLSRVSQAPKSKPQKGS